jgi:hypothetical protein
MRPCSQDKEWTDDCLKRDMSCHEVSVLSVCCCCAQSARCMECGTPFCHQLDSGCPLGGLADIHVDSVRSHDTLSCKAATSYSFHDHAPKPDRSRAKQSPAAQLAVTAEHTRHDSSEQAKPLVLQRDVAG